jgi:predicted Zn-dependent protease
MRVYCAAGLFFLVIMLGSLSGSAQFSVKPAAFLDTIPADVHAAMKARLEVENQSITASKIKVRSFIKMLHKERFEYTVKLFNDDYVIIDSELNTYVEKIFNNICRSNPQIPQDAILYIERSSVANATSYGEGTIVISVSLLARLENDAQLAFVLSHELAHYYRGHTKEVVNQYAEINFDKELNKESRDIRKSQYGRYTRMREFMKGIELMHNKHSRVKEFEADSVGLTFFRNSAYVDLIAPVRTMEILDSVEYEIFRDNLDLKKYFDFKEYPFKASWENYKKPDMWRIRKDKSDTARTHPSCKKRGLALMRQLRFDSHSPVYTQREDFERIRRQAKVDLIETSYHFKKYGRALFDALALSEQYPEDVWLHSMIGKCLYQLYQNQANHELGKVLELPGQHNEENYDRLLTFIHQLRLTELENIAYFYIINQNETYFSDEEFLYTAWLASSLKISKLSPHAVAEDYRMKFPEGKYLTVMK